MSVNEIGVGYKLNGAIGGAPGFARETVKTVGEISSALYTGLKPRY